MISDDRLADRTLIFVGDYINRGPASREVVDLLVELSDSSERKTIFLRGNHEAYLLRWIEEGDRSAFLRNGGLATIRSYTSDRSPGVIDRFTETLPPSHVEFLVQTRLYYESDDIFVSHAGFDPAEPGRRDPDSMIHGQRSERLTPAAAGRSLGGKKIIFGHYVQKGNRPLADDPVYCIDTGCGTLPDGVLTVLVFPELEVRQF